MVLPTVAAQMPGRGPTTAYTARAYVQTRRRPRRGLTLVLNKRVLCYLSKFVF